MMKITADMLPKESGDVIRFFFEAAFPEGQTVEELKASPHRCFRNIGLYYEKEMNKNGN